MSNRRDQRNGEARDSDSESALSAISNSIRSLLGRRSEGTSPSPGRSLSPNGTRSPLSGASTPLRSDQSSVSDGEGEFFEAEEDEFVDVEADDEEAEGEELFGDNMEQYETSIFRYRYC